MSELIGLKRGKLWAIGLNEMRKDPNFILVICECGRYNETEKNTFLNANFKCICENNKLDLTNKYFGTWKVISFSEKRKNMAYWKCICTKCNTEKEIAYSNLTQRMGGLCKKCNDGKPKERPGKLPEVDLSKLINNLTGQMHRTKLLNSGDPEALRFIQELDAQTAERQASEAGQGPATEPQEAPLTSSQPALPFPKAPWQSQGIIERRKEMKEDCNICGCKICDCCGLCSNPDCEEFYGNEESEAAEITSEMWTTLGQRNTKIGSNQQSIARCFLPNFLTAFDNGHYVTLENICQMQKNLESVNMNLTVLS